MSLAALSQIRRHSFQAVYWQMRTTQREQLLGGARDHQSEAANARKGHVPLVALRHATGLTGPPS
jgi:hypothetical protein